MNSGSAIGITIGSVSRTVNKPKVRRRPSLPMRRWITGQVCPLCVPDAPLAVEQLLP
ncbi:hypothetical protein [Synechococcus sp. H70.1]|uniref:hypothetical protein n=1 Tax=Synechococcus sp. H70.1 TaxID=2964527 RepID=UPI0039C60E2D